MIKNKLVKVLSFVALAIFAFAAHAATCPSVATAISQINAATLSASTTSVAPFHYSATLSDGTVIDYFTQTQPTKVSPDTQLKSLAAALKTGIPLSVASGSTSVACAYLGSATGTAPDFTPTFNAWDQVIVITSSGVVPPTTVAATVTITGDLATLGGHNVPVTLSGTTNYGPVTIKANDSAIAFGTINTGSYTAGPATLTVNGTVYHLQSSAVEVTAISPNITLEYDTTPPSPTAVAATVTITGNLTSVAGESVPVALTGVTDYGPVNIAANGSPISFATINTGSYTVAPPIVTASNGTVYHLQSSTVQVSTSNTNISLEYDSTPPVTVAATVTITGDLISVAGENVPVSLVGATSYGPISIAANGSAIPFGTINTGFYTAGPSTMTVDGTAYYLQSSAVDVTTTATNVTLEYDKIVPHTVIPGWPNYLAMGTVTNDAGIVGDFLASPDHPVDAIFKYSGDGQGDLGKIVDPPIYTNETIAQARSIEAVSAHSVMPTMVVYTINASGGMYPAFQFVNLDPDTGAQVPGSNELSYHYTNLILIAAAMEAKKDGTHPHPGTILLNPDLIGAMQQSTYFTPILLKATIPVNEQLTVALAYIKQHHPEITVMPPPSFPENFEGYMESINYLIRTYGPDVPFGWHENVWAPGSGQWVHKNYTAAQLKTTISDPLVTFIQTNIPAFYAGTYRPDFMYFDKYEHDAFTTTAPVNGWFWRKRDWDNYMSYVQNISTAFGLPVILWQIPGGHLLTQGDTSGLPLSNVSTAPDYFFGDSALTSLALLQSQVTNFVLFGSQDSCAINNCYEGQTTAGGYLSLDSDQDWSQSTLQSAAAHNVVAILWGGGDTTGIAPPFNTDAGNDNGWLAAKVKTYYANPVVLSSSSNYSKK